MRRRRSNDPLGDTATTLGNAMDELMRHHPDLKTEAMKAVIKVSKYFMKQIFANFHFSLKHFSMKLSFKLIFIFKKIWVKVIRRNLRLWHKPSIYM